ncbi:MAG TPA: Gfo/Idh/MocA family oxidoreductase [Bryobacteraceae bacterium]|jgi:predicted dehydrogenase|nr:Gfo/Idh/MocA family oxidoreductase [Bryobacteraceae bacterium]
MRLGVIGLGFMGSTHLRAAQSVPGLEIAAVCSRDSRKLAGDFREVRGNHGETGGCIDLTGAAKYREIAALLADDSIEAVDICLPTGMHEGIAVEALRAGKHVLVEKPMALDGASADRMVAEAERCGRVLMAAQVIRFWPEYAALRETLRSGHLGAFRGAVFRRRCAAPSWGTWEGGGAFDLLIHDFDFALHLFGRPQAVSASGYADDEARIDLLHATLFYAGGAAVLITGGWLNRGDYPFSMEFTATFDRDTVEFSTASGAGVLDGPPGQAYAAELAHFVACCGGQPNELCPPRESADAIRLLRFALDARRLEGEKIACTI